MPKPLFRKVFTIIRAPSRKPVLISLVSVLIIASVVGFVCLMILETKSAQLQELESLASNIQLNTGSEVSRSSQDTEAGFTGPIYAELRIEYEPIDNYTKEDVYNEIVSILIENGWTGEECEGCRTPSFSASLQQDDYPIPIGTRVRIQSDQRLVSIRMEHPRP